MRLPVAVRIALVVAILAGIFFRAYHLDRKTYWEDEIVGTVRALGYTEAHIVAAAPGIGDAAGLQKYFHPATPAMGGDRLGDTVKSLAAEDPQHPPLYYVLSHLWIDRFGSSVEAIRGLPMLFGLLALPVAYWFAFELFGSAAVALLATALFAISPFHVLYAQEAREYSLWTLVILGCGVAFLRACKSMSALAWIVYAALVTASLYVFPFSGLVVLGQGASLAIVADANRRRALAYYAASCLVALLAFAPWLAIMLTNRAMERGLGRIWSAHLSGPTIAGTLAKNLRQSFFDIGTPHAGASRLGAVDAVLTIAVTAAAAYALIFLARHATRRAASYVIFALCAPAVPLVLSDLLRHGMLVAQSRYFTPLYLGIEIAFAYVLCVQMSGGARAVRQRPLWAATTLGVILAGFLSCVASARSDTWWNKDYEQSRDVAAVINRSSAPLVVERVNSSRSLGLAFYLEPSVKLAMQLRCDNCDGRRIGTIAGARAPLTPQGSMNVFVLGDARTSAPHRTVGTTVYPIAAEPLGMFRAI